MPMEKINKLLLRSWNILEKTHFSSDCVFHYSFYIGIFYPEGEPISAHLLRCGGFAVDNHSFTRRRLVTGPSLARE